MSNIAFPRTFRHSQQWIPIYEMAIQCQHSRIEGLSKLLLFHSRLQSLPGSASKEILYIILFESSLTDCTLFYLSPPRNMCTPILFILFNWCHKGSLPQPPFHGANILFLSYETGASQCDSSYYFFLLGRRGTWPPSAFSWLHLDPSIYGPWPQRASF